MLRRTTQVLSAGGIAFEQVNYSYGTSTGINDLAGRVESVSVGSSSPPTVPPPAPAPSTWSTRSTG